ncbi:PREDICTED: annexin A1-like [Nanorana parkeri]|uniref:annexin A1-like n=1 Tax=Nanorana parkeri TaxID=125878 RepID=UPI0008546A15|nr:PREDICTED: annexin A1-like [Nanorana parkeri]
MEQQASVVQQILQASHQIKETCTNAQEVQGGVDLARPRSNPIEDASALEKAITAKGVDEGTIIDILTKRTNEQRQEIKVAYQKKTGKTLEESLKKALSGKLQPLMLDLIKTPAQFDAHELNRATKGLGTDEDTIIEICVTRTNQQLPQIKKVYSAEFKTDLEKDIIDDTSGDFQKAIVALLKGTRSEDCYVNAALADQDAKALYEAGEKQKKADASVFINILTTRSFAHLQQVFKKYATYSKHDLNKAMDLELKGDIEKCLVAIVKYAMNKPGYFAEKVQLAMKGLGTREKILNRVIISRSEVDMKSIKAQYHQLYKTSMRDDCMTETSGNYETALVGLIGYDD